jgi:hypothetical protein
MRFRFLGSVSLFWLLLSCVESSSNPAGVLVRDSAGVEIVQNLEPAWAEGENWRLSVTPTLLIGSEEDGPGPFFHRITTAIQLDDRTIVVGDAGSNRLFYFTDEGEPIAEVGREGSGPGEFRSIRQLWKVDSGHLLVYDGLLRRLSAFDGRGGFIETHATSATSTPFGRLSDGSIIGTEQDWNPSEMGSIRDPLRVLRFAPDGEILDTLAVVPGDQEYRARADGMVLNLELPFGKKQSLVARDSVIVAGAGDSYEIAVYQVGRGLVRLLRRPNEELGITDEDMALYREGILGGISRPDLRRTWERILAEAPVPETRPAYSAIEIDALGNLWVQDYGFSGSAATTWTVFTPEGRWLGEVEFPSNLRVTEIGADYVLGVHRNDYDVEVVHCYALGTQP